MEVDEAYKRGVASVNSDYDALVKAVSDDLNACEKKLAKTYQPRDSSGRWVKVNGKWVDLDGK